MKDENKTDTPKHFSWSDILAFCLALYRILLPQLLITFLIAAAVIALLFFFVY